MITDLLVAALIVVILLLVGYVIWYRKFRSTKGSLTTNRQVYVGNFPYHVNEDDLEDLFTSFGTIEDIKIVKDFNSRRSKGFGFVTFADSKEARNALQVHGNDFQGRSIVVRIAKPRPDKQ